MTDGPRLLIVEDDEATRAAVTRFLRAHELAVIEAADAGEALRRWTASRPDLVVLDLGLPDRDGLVVIRRIRREAATPILVLSARGAEHDKVAALDAGADDYVTKPFGMEELRARVTALLRRSSRPAADANGIVAVGPVMLDPTRRRVTAAGQAVELTPREFELLRVLLDQPGRVVTRGRLLRAVWGEAYAEEGHYLHVYVSRLRRKLGEADPSGRSGRLIIAEPGVGYRVEDESGGPDPG